MIKFADFQKDFWFGITNLQIFYNCPYQIKGCVVLLCTNGQAALAVGIQEFTFKKNGEMIILPESTLVLTKASEDFKCSIFIFSKELYYELSIQLGVNFAQYLHTTPFYIHKENTLKLKYFKTWMDAAQLLHKRRNIYFKLEMYRNFIQSYLIYLYNAIQYLLEEINKKMTRKEVFFHQFTSLLNVHCKEHRDVSFYANKLHITERYLWIITNHITENESPKIIIDKRLILEIKLLLRSTNLSIQEIAHELNFSNQSYLGRYFKHHAGISPSEYRKDQLVRRKKLQTII